MEVIKRLVVPRARIAHLRWILGLCLFGALSVASTWPLAENLEHSYPLGSERNATVTFASAWALWWTSDRASHGFEDYWHAPIFFPTEESFALSEPMPALGLMAIPWLRSGLSLSTAYGLVLLMCLALNGLTAFHLLSWLGLRDAPALVGGSFVTLLPCVQHELGVLTLVPVFGVILTLHASCALIKAPSWQSGACLGLAFSLTYFMCAQYALFVGLALVVTLPWWARRLFSRSGGAALLASLATVSCLVGPVAYSQRAALAKHHFVRSEERVRDGASKLMQWTRTASHELIPTPGLRQAPSTRPALFPGTLRSLLALVALAFLVRRRARRGLWPLFLGVALVDFLLSVLPHLRWWVFEPYAWLRAVAPGLAMVRSLWRAAVIPHLIVTLLSAFGLHLMIERVRGSARHRVLSMGLLAAFAALATVEQWPAPQVLAEAPSELAYRPLVRWIERHVGRHEPLAYLPFPSAGAASLFEDTARFMLLQRSHGRPMVNGYSSYFPAPHERLYGHRLKLSDASTPALLREYGVRYVVVLEKPNTERALPQARANGFALQMRKTDLGVSVYRVP